MRKLILFGAALALAAPLASPALASLATGASAPDIQLDGALAGNPFHTKLSAALKKGPVVLYFFPAAFTQGCNAEAHAFAEAARLIVEGGVSKLLVAGGETSGAVVQGLGIATLEIGPEIDPGVPWTRVVGGPDIVIALKSGNFGAPDFFVKSWTLLD